METFTERSARYPAVASCIVAAALSVTATDSLARGASVRDEQANRLVQQAIAYEHGEGVPRDPARAAQLYCRAARLGEPEAMFALGWMYANGRGLPRHDGYAGTLFAMAAELGDAHARQMARFTGPYTGETPDCLRPEAVALRTEMFRTPEEQVGALPPERQKIARLVIELSEQYGINPQLALAIALAESNLNPIAVSPRKAMGVMQLIPDTAARFNVKNPFDARQNIMGGLAYLRWLLAYFKGDVALAAAGYNAGEGAVERHRGVPPYRETRAYVERILAFVGKAEHPFDSRVTAPSMMLRDLRIAGGADSKQ